MIWQDCVHGTFELAGGFFILLHVLRLLRDKEVRGVSAIAVAYMTLWGFWNMYYYPFLAQWFSTFGGAAIALINTAWVVLLFYYLRKERKAKNERQSKHDAK